MSKSAGGRAFQEEGDQPCDGRDGCAEETERSSAGWGASMTCEGSEV